MPRRPIANALTEAELLAHLHANNGHFDLDGAMDRWAVDFLGKAIGHEQAYETRAGLPPTMFYSNLIHELDHTATRKIMAFTAARETMSQVQR